MINKIQLKFPGKSSFGIVGAGTVIECLSYHEMGHYHPLIMYALRPLCCTLYLTQIDHVLGHWFISPPPWVRPELLEDTNTKTVSLDN